MKGWTNTGRRARSRVTLLSIAVALAGCSASEATPESVSADAERYAQVFCERTLACPLGELDFGDRASCERFAVATFCGDTELALPGLDACSRALEREGNCQEERTAALPAECDGVALALARRLGVTPVGAGETCDLTHPCKSGTFCTGEYSTDTGVCQPVGKEGEPCTEIGSCGLGLHCDHDIGSIESTCRKQGPVGTPCLSGRECGDGLDCVEDTCVDPYSLLGMPCVDATPCGHELLCFEGACAPKRTEGESCTRVGECVLGTACVDGTCEATSACGQGVIGDGCHFDVQCASGLDCDFETQRCR